MTTLLFKIDGPKPFFVFGSAHVISAAQAQALAPVTRQVTDIVTTSELVFSEGDVALNRKFFKEIVSADKAAIDAFDDATRRRYDRAKKIFFLPEGRAIKDCLPRAAYSRLVELYGAHEISAMELNANRQAVWRHVFDVEEMAICGLGRFSERVAMDMALLSEVDELKTNIIGFDSYEEIALDIFGNLDEACQIALLEEALAAADAGFFATLMDAYMRFDYEDCYQCFMRLWKLDKPDAPEWRWQFKRKIQDRRSEKWVNAIMPHIGKNSAILICGVGHLGGEEGVIRLLQKRGFHVAPVPLAPVNVSPAPPTPRARGS